MRVFFLFALTVLGNAAAFAQTFEAASIHESKGQFMEGKGSDYSESRKLEDRKRPMEIIVVDHMEKPSEN